MSGGSYNYIYNQLFPMYGGYVYMTDIKEIEEKLKEKTEMIREIHDGVAREMYCKGVGDFANWLVEQNILGNRCISDGEITDYGRVYAKKYKEQLKMY